jgi:murein DD-endopeptidase MepM/ murein hydrolase activator NlpD
VALGAASNLPDAKAVSPTILANLENASVTTNGIAERSDSQRASRDSNREGEAAKPAKPAPPAAEGDAWLLPLDDYVFTSPYGVRGERLHRGVDLAAPEGTPYKAVHGGVVKAAGYNGGYGYSVTVARPDGIETIYAHSRRVLVQVGQTVKAGDVIGEVGNTGYSYGTHLHIEVHVNGQTTDPITLMRRHGADVKLQIESVYGDLAAS